MLLTGIPLWAVGAARLEPQDESARAPRSVAVGLGAGWASVSGAF